MLFLDLVKAFDRVPRNLLWDILGKFGVPPKLIRLLRVLHANVKVKFTVDDVSHIISSIIGVKQGDILGPILFIFFMAAIMITWRIIYGGPLCLFKTKPDFILTGRSYRARGEEFAVPGAEYADDAAVLFESRNSLEVGVPRLISHFYRFGMDVHVGNRHLEKKSKSEVLFCSKPAIMYDDPETFDGTNLSDIDLGDGISIPIVSKFPYLGSILSRDCTDILDVEARILKAGQAFGALRKCLFSSTQITYAAKNQVYCGLILSILLYASESWCLTEKLFRQLRNFHARCLRAMCRVTRWHTRHQHISTNELLMRLGLSSIDIYTVRRQLRWAGHVSRMQINRVPRKLLSSWVRHKRPQGSPQFTYGRALKKSLRIANIDIQTWFVSARNRDSWRNIIKTLH